MQAISLIILAFVVYSKAQQATPGVYFSNIGGAGTYPQVVNQPSGVWPSCNEATPCQQTNVSVPAQPLAPFNEEMSIQLRGPLQMTRIAIYQMVNGQQQLVSNWQPGMPLTNMVFLMNSANDWSVCQGNALGFASAAGDSWSQTPQNFGGYLAGGLELTVMSGVPCNNDCGWYRGTGYHGWAGDKIFVIETSMPTSTNGNDMPAVWSLNAKIPRTGQYGCNCGRRGCGEFDIAEVLSNGDNKAYQTIYSYNGDLGSPAYFPRPLTSQATYVVHYSMGDNKIYAVNLPGSCFQYSSILSSGYLSNIHSLASDVNSMYTSPRSNLVGTCPSVPSTSSPTSAPTTVLPTTAVPTTTVPTTVAPTTVARTTKAPTVPTTTVPVTTVKITTAAPTTAKITVAPTTVKVTAAPTTAKAVTTTKATSKVTVAPTTKPTTRAPTTKRVTSAPTTTRAVTTRAATTRALTTRPPTSPAPTPGLVLCGQYYCASCCNDMLQGPVCIYQPDQYWCASGKRLCGIGADVCGQDCYDTSLYVCNNGKIAQKPSP